jgi:hypothetical protein
MSTAMNVDRAPWRTRCPGRITALVAAALVMAPLRWGIAHGAQARTFRSATDASDALFEAVRNGDAHTVEAILGSTDGLASCGEESRDSRDRERFVEKYQQMHRLVREPDGSTVLYVGAENWPFPIPLVSSHGQWHFDAKAGWREVTFRRIGANEATAIEVSRATVEAVKHDATPSGTDPLLGYAERLAAAARASSGTTARVTPDEKPFRGYHFVVLKSGGITVVAYPAEYRSSGVMTFMVGEDGVVYERDLGRDTASVARGLKARPASGWRTIG